MSRSLAYFNPVFKFIALLLLVVLPWVFPSIVGLVCCYLLIKQLLGNLYTEHEVKKMLKKRSFILMVVFAIITCCMVYLMKLPEIYFKNYDIRYIYYPLFVGLYSGTLYLYGKMIRYSTTLFEFWSSMNDTLHVPKYIAYTGYRISLFLANFSSEYALVNRMFMTRGINTGHISLRVLEVVIHNLKRKIEENDLIMESKGFDHHMPNMQGKERSWSIADWVLPISILGILIIMHIVVSRGFLL